MKIILAILLQIFFIGIISSQAQDIGVFNHPVLKNDLKILKEHVPQPQEFGGNFSQIKTIEGINKKFISKGKFSFSKVAGLSWKTVIPFTSNLLFTKDKLVKIENDGKEIILQSDQASFKEISIIFQSLFSGDYKKLNEYFDVFFLKKSKGNWIIGLKPNSRIIKESLSGITLKGNSAIKEILLEEASGDKMLIKFSDVS